MVFAQFFEAQTLINEQDRIINTEQGSIFCLLLK